MNNTPDPILNFDTRKALVFALAAERLSAFYEHGKWITDSQASTLAAMWLQRSKLQLAPGERKLLSELSDQLARQLADTLSREAGLYAAHDMMEALDPNYQSAFAHDMLDECARLLRENGVEE